MKKTLIAAALISIAAAAAKCDDSFSAKFYGTIKTDMQYVDGNSSSNEYAVYSLPGAPNSTFRSSAKATRIGVNLADTGLDMKATIEADFLGLTEAGAGQTAGSTSDLRIRHAFVTKSLGSFSVLAGQTWSLMSNELPDTVQDYYLGYSGALWGRATQIRGTYKMNDMFTFIVAAARPTKALTDANGDYSGLPGAQAQIAAAYGKSKVSLTGVWERQENTTNVKADTYLADLGFETGYGPLSLNGQAWMGRNVDDFLGGASNSSASNIFNPRGGIRAMGGFADLKYKPVDKFYINLIAGMDKPMDSDVIATASTTSTSNRLQNGTIEANINYVYSKVITTLEAAHNETEYYDTTAGSYFSSSNRVQLSMRYPF